MKNTITSLRTKGGDPREKARVKTNVNLDFNDEGINLVAEVKVCGDAGAADKYLPIFERDLRRKYKSLFPIPEELEPEDPIKEGDTK